MDLIGRKWTMEKGAVFSRWIQAIKDFYEINTDTPGWEREFEQLGKAIKSYQEIQMCLAGFSKDKNKSGLIPTYAKRIMMATAQLYGGRLLLDQALLAEKKIQELGPDHYDYKFYQGKIMAARYFLLNVVPEVAGLAEIVKLADTSVLDIDIECFEY